MTSGAPLRLRFIGWSALMLAMLAIFAGFVLPNPRVETDILALLPQTQTDRGFDAPLAEFSAQLARKQIFLIGSDRLEDAKLAAAAFANALETSGAFISVQWQFDSDLTQRAEVYRVHRAFLLSPKDRQALEAGVVEPLVKRALRAAYTPTGLMQPLGLAEDPLGFTSNFLRATAGFVGNTRVEGNMLVAEGDGRDFVLVLTENSGHPFASSTQERVVPAIALARLAASLATNRPVEIAGSGAIQHASAAAERARHEVTTFGTIETIAVVLLLLLVFGSMRPLLLGLLTLVLAIAAAYTVVHFMFGKVHILALVFGSSLIGSVIDYSIHFFADRFRDPEHWTPAAALSHVGPAILLGLTTTLVGYLVLAAVPFPGLEQIAVFCMTGLVVGCGCVLCLYPVLARARGQLPKFGPVIGHVIDRVLRNWRWTNLSFIVMAGLAVWVALGMARVQIQDDVKALQQSPAQLVSEEQRVREVVGSGIETRFFLVSGDSAQAVLETEERLTQALDELVSKKALASYQAASTGVPSLGIQRRNHDLLSNLVYAPGSLLEQVMTTLGFPPSAIGRRRAEFEGADAPLTVEEWLSSPASQGARHLWLGQVGSRYASVVTLGGITDVSSLKRVQLPGVRLIDRIAQTTETLSRYRYVMTLLLAAVYAVAGLVLVLRFGWRDAPRMLLPSVAATLTTVGIFGWLGVPFNLFTLLALWLVLGLGIDYGIFLR
ncbi:MAG TPA: MMPL family transporter, partial [Steroidobacteraceae bacterium]|nr:MMPL family transporter [Steroidobacteraceae bacterium]